MELVQDKRNIFFDNGAERSSFTCVKTNVLKLWY